MGIVDLLQPLREELLDRAEVFDRPDDYIAGVEDALDRVRVTLVADPAAPAPSAEELPPVGAWFG